MFELDTTTKHSYLHHSSAVGEFFLSSDSIVHSYRRAYGNRVGALMAQIPPEHVAEVHDEGSTIGGYMVFPGDVRDRVEFFLLEDLVDPATDEIRWCLPFDDFMRSPLPQSVSEYETYRRAALRFVRARNQRIDAWASANLSNPVPESD